ncbi:hypothetical protein L1Q52_02455, partial [Klebsiella pneumoniae]
MVRVIICHQLNTKNNIISGSEVSRLSVAIQKYHLSDVCFYITLSLGLISYKSVILLAVGRVN